jgi:DNA-binding protein WhiA
MWCDWSGTGTPQRAGLLDSLGRPVRGLPARIVSGPACDAAAVWRGAFLAHGSLTASGRSTTLAVSCPGHEAALALAGAARRIGIRAKAVQIRGVDQAVVRDQDAITAMLARLGAPEAAVAWQGHRAPRPPPPTPPPPAFQHPNPRRAARAAAAAHARVERAIAILGDEVPDHLRAAGQLRLDHAQASLEDLGKLADPPTTKDTISGRIRRLVTMADKHAAHLGIPGTADQPPAWPG